jgi:MYND finger
VDLSNVPIGITTTTSTSMSMTRRRRRDENRIGGVWNSTKALGPSIRKKMKNKKMTPLVAFCNHDVRIVVEMHIKSAGAPAVREHTVADFPTDFADLTTTFPIRPFQFAIVEGATQPKMTFTRTFHFTDRAMDFYGDDIVDEWTATNVQLKGFTPNEFSAMIVKLAKRNDAMVILHLIAFPDQRREQAGFALLIDCVPVVSSLVGTTCNKCHKPPPINLTNNNPKIFPQCSRCNSVCYCSRACQKSDWKDHKPSCTDAANATAAAAANARVDDA